MGLTAEDKVFVLQRFVNSYATDLMVLHAALGDPSMPPDAQRYLVGALNYALDPMDMLPDHRGPIGIVDDAIVLRIGAKLARAAGAKQPALEPLALDANNVFNVFEDLAEPLEKLVMTFPRREVRGRTADKIMTSNLARAAFLGDVAAQAKRFTPERMATGTAAPKVIAELYRAMRDTLIAAKLHR